MELPKDALKRFCMLHPLTKGRAAQYCQHQPPQPGIAKNGGGQNARATGGPGILPET
jgi:hypothetical protein